MDSGPSQPEVEADQETELHPADALSAPRKPTRGDLARALRLGPRITRSPA